MATPDQYEEQARHNESWANMLAGDAEERRREWGIVAAFYAAVHYLDAQISIRLTHESQNHGDRFYHLRLLHPPHGVRDRYEQLFEASKQVRYEPFLSRPAFTSQDVRDFIDGDLQDIKRWLGY